MIELNRILLATDFSPCSHEALEYGCELSKRFGAELHLLHVAEEARSLFSSPEEAIPAEVLEQDWEETEQELERTANVLRKEGRTVEPSVIRGVAFVQIIQYAREHDIDLIVLGTHGRTGLSQVLLGSVAERVVRKAPCPVLVVRQSGHQFVMP